MVIKTDDSSSYEFFVEDGNVCFKQGSTEGIVTELSGLKIGEHLTIKYYPLDAKQSFPSMVITPCITEII